MRLQMFKPATAILTFTVGVVLTSALLIRFHHPVNSEVARLEPPQSRLILTRVAPTYEYNRFGFSDVAVLENGEAWAVGYDGADPKRMFHSKDGGSSWKIVTHPYAAFTLNAVDFVDNLHGWAVGGYGTVLRTSDGGNTWVKLKRPTDWELSVVQFVDKQVGYVASRTEWGCEIWRTTNGGDSWRLSYKASDYGQVFGMAMLDEQIAVAAMNDTSLIRTENGGRTWQSIDSPMKGAASLVFTSDGTGWLVGRRGSFYYSIDKGKTWQRPTALSEDALNYEWTSIDFDNNKNGVAVGYGGKILTTNDGGKTWRDESLNNSERFRLVRLNNNIGIVFSHEYVYRISRTR